MNELQQITVGIGLHPRTGVPDAGSMRAARQAAWVASRVGAKVTLLHAAWAEDGTGPIDVAPGAEAELDELCMLMGADGARAGYEFVKGHPWHMLVRRALAGDADLIVAGKRSTTERTRRRVGSTAMRVMRKSPAPVWLVKPDHDLTHRHVLASTDLSAVSELAVESAAWIAGQSKGELHVLHAWNLTPEQQRDSSSMTESEYNALVEDARAHALSALEHSVSGLETDPELQLERGVAHLEIMKEVEEQHPDLLVMGSLSIGGRPGFHMGTVAERVLGQVDESILAFKPGDFVCPVALD
ncbi:universal stress protein [Planctomycetes bacterium Poly30]